MFRSKKRTIIVHGHIFKNAGSTFDWSLKRNFNKGFIDHRDNEEMRQGASNYLADFIQDNKRLKAVSTHHLYWCMPLPERENLEIIPCFFLRHPIERVRSVYDFERRQESDTPGAVHAKKLNFKDYVAWRLDHIGGGVVMDYQIKYCSGRRGVPIDDVFVKATAHSMSTLALTGIVDRFDESMVYFEHMLKDKFPRIDLSYVRQNVSEGGLSTLSVSDKVDAVIDELGSGAALLESSNTADLGLYTLANEALNRHITKIASFDKKLENFRNRCDKLNSNSRLSRR